MPSREIAGRHNEQELKHETDLRQHDERADQVDGDVKVRGDRLGIKEALSAPATLDGPLLLHVRPGAYQPEHLA